MNQFPLSALLLFGPPVISLLPRDKQAQHLHEDEQVDQPHPDMSGFEQALGCWCLPLVGPDDGGKHAPVDKVPDDGLHEILSLLQMKKAHAACAGGLGC